MPCDLCSSVKSCGREASLSLRKRPRGWSSPMVRCLPATRYDVTDLPSSEPVASPPRRRRVRRRLATAFAGFCLLLVLLVIALQSDPARQLALRRITALLASRQIVVQVDSLRYNLFTLS